MNKMKAVLYESYASKPSEVMQVQRVARLAIQNPKQLLVRVYATSINSWDLDRVVGDFTNRAMFGWRAPSPSRRCLGVDVAGVVVDVGEEAKKVGKFSKGDLVFADVSNSAWGCFAEYVCDDYEWFARAPRNATAAEAAAVPQAGVLAYQAVKDHLGDGRTKRFLINGAGGGVGMFAIQLIKRDLARHHVTAVDCASKLDFLRYLGADELIDYEKSDFIDTFSNEEKDRYDLIVDMHYNRWPSAFARLLRPNTGRCVVVGGHIPSILYLVTINLVYNTQCQLLLHQPNASHLRALAEMIDNGSLRVFIDKHRRFTRLESIVEAMDYFALDSKTFCGKIVIDMEEGVRKRELIENL